MLGWSPQAGAEFRAWHRPLVQQLIPDCGLLLLKLLPHLPGAQPVMSTLNDDASWLTSPTANPQGRGPPSPAPSPALLNPEPHSQHKAWHCTSGSASSEMTPSLGGPH